MRDARVNRAEGAYRALAPAGFGLVWAVSLLLGASRRELRSRVGEVPAAGSPLVWFHGASAGEMAAALKLADLLRGSGRRFTAAFTTTNRAGIDLVARLAPPDHVATLVPWDAPRWVARTFDRWRPRALFLIETELWPNLVLEAWRRSIPVLVVSGRIYARDLARYRAIRPLIRPTLERLSAIVAQSEVERERFVRLGAPAERCIVGGNLKHLATERTSSGSGFRATWNSRPAVVFGSVHRDELRTVFSALDRTAAGPSALPRNRSRHDRRCAGAPPRAIIAPRHLSSVPAIMRTAARRGWIALRSSEAVPDATWDLLVLDRMGELASAYANAAVAVVGGGFGRHGGHNPLEPVMQGTPVMAGRDLDHFPDDAERLARATPEAIVDAPALGAQLTAWLEDPVLRRDILARQRAALPCSQEIAARYLAALAPWLDGSDRPAPP